MLVKPIGELYYYSFLNLAKAFIAAKRVIPAKYLKSSNIYHGLSANPQAPSQIIDFEIQIHPPVISGRQNIFSTFYEKITNQRWPHTLPITIRLSEILPYCSEISSEINKFYGITLNIIRIQSLIRELDNNLWFEVNLPLQSADVVQSHINNIQLTIVNIDALTVFDKSDWLTAYKRTMGSLHDTCFLRTQQTQFTQENRQQILTQLNKMINNAFGEYALSMPVVGINDEPWLFIPKIHLSNSLIKWHPLLSDYLIAFIMSTILRYHPHLLSANNKDSFFAEAWCAQSAITFLRYFLMVLTTPSIRCN